MNIRRILFLICILFSSVGILKAEDLSIPYSPTRSEWLEMISYKATNETVSLWAAHVSVNTIYLEQQNAIVITLTIKNGELPLNDKIKKGYIEIVQIAIESIIYEYSWASEVKVIVQFL